jgi:hypothetical protein
MSIHFLTDRNATDIENFFVEQDSCFKLASLSISNSLDDNLSKKEIGYFDENKIVGYLSVNDCNTNILQFVQKYHSSNIKYLLIRRLIIHHKFESKTQIANELISFIEKYAFEQNYAFICLVFPSNNGIRSSF